jgi:hypothetical protein
MSQSAIRSKWKFIVEFEDEETKEISGTIGQADTRGECEELVEFDVQYHIFNGRTVINAEAAEICAKCEGEGKLEAGNCGQVICDACCGHVGPIRRFKAERGPQESHPAKRVHLYPTPLPLRAGSWQRTCTAR